MGLFSKKGMELKNEYAMMESQMMANPTALMKGLGVRDVELKINSSMSPKQMEQAFQQLLQQRRYNLVLLRDFIAQDQKKFFSTNDINMDIRHMFKDVDITDSIFIQRRIGNIKPYQNTEYSERVLWNYLNDLSNNHKHAFCVSGTLKQIDNLVLLNLKSNKEGAILKDGSCFFPVKLYEKFFTEIRRGNNVVVL